MFWITTNQFNYNPPTSDRSSKSRWQAWLQMTVQCPSPHHRVLLRVTMIPSLMLWPSVAGWWARPWIALAQGRRGRPPNRTGGSHGTHWHRGWRAICIYSWPSFLWPLDRMGCIGHSLQAPWTSKYQTCRKHPQLIKFVIIRDSVTELEPNWLSW
jgi:hypothetical protein